MSTDFTAGWDSVEPGAESYYERLTVDSAVTILKEMCAEWSYAEDPHGYCHERAPIQTVLRALDEIHQEGEVSTQQPAQHDLNPSDWTMTMSEGGETYPFVEDENANITGFGHQDPAEFVAAVNRYDAECNDGPIDGVDLWPVEAIDHCWVTLDPDGERVHGCTRDTPGATPVTALWGQR